MNGKNSLSECHCCGGPRKRRERKARLELRAARVDLAPPTNRTGDAAPLAMLAVSVFEPDPPNGKAPLHWVLLTTEGEADIDNARRIVAWYEARWTIEEYFRILKVGTRVEDRKLDHADDLRKCLAFDAVTAWRVMDLERRARDTPERPALEWFSEHAMCSTSGSDTAASFARPRKGRQISALS